MRGPGLVSRPLFISGEMMEGHTGENRPVVGIVLYFVRKTDIINHILGHWACKG